MNKGTIITSALLLTAVVALFAILPKLQVSKDSITAGSVTVGNEYMATTTKNAAGTALTSRVLKTGPGSLGSVIITGSGAGYVELYDATTTPTGATPLLASLPVSVAVGNYVYDIAFSTGLYYLTAGTNTPTSTITFR